jgi:hypothetical protein
MTVLNPVRWLLVQGYASLYECIVTISGLANKGENNNKNNINLFKYSPTYYVYIIIVYIVERTVEKIELKMILK